MKYAPAGWIKQLESSILESKIVPMWGAFPGFAWEVFSKAFSDHFAIAPFTLRMGKAEWKAESATFAGMGDSPLQLSVEMTPLQGSLSLIIPLEDFTKLSSWAIDTKVSREGFADPVLQKGFFRYLALETLHLIDGMQIFKGLKPKVIDMPLSREKAYCVDMALEKGEEIIWARLVCPPLFHKAFQDYYAGEFSLLHPMPIYEEIDIDLSVTAGRVFLTQKSWSALSEGSLLILDYCSFSPKVQRGTFQLIFDQTPLFQLKLKEDKIKILDYAFYYEENRMNEDNFEAVDEASEDQMHLPEDLEVGEEEQEIQSISVEKKSPGEVMHASRVPIHLSVEVAKMKINLDTLLKLKPGNVLDLKVMPERGVSLIANGKCVAKGDLVQIGDVIGVKITKIGHL